MHIDKNTDLKDALKGFVNQKTNFKYEVLIHDDADEEVKKRIDTLHERNKFKLELMPVFPYEG